MTAPPAHPSLDILVPGASFRQYKLLERIGVGGQGVVWSALEPGQKRILAIKFSEIPDGDQARAEDDRADQQLKRLITLQHPHILPFLEYGFEHNLRFTISPYVSGHTLAHKIRKADLPFNEILRYGLEVASALDYLHQEGIIHRDLKTSNILLDMNGHTYLADFGLARLISSSTLAFHTGHGTPPYASPEQIQARQITPRSDIFSFGILLYELFTGHLPWNGKKQLGLEQTHSQQEIPDPREVNERLPPLTVEVLRRATSADPQFRPPSAGEVMRLLFGVFKVSSSNLPGWISPQGDGTQNRDVDELLQQGLARWKSTNGLYGLGLTNFVLVDFEREKIDTPALRRFMLSQALTYGYHDDEWWSIVENPRERVAVSSEVLGKKNEAIAGRIVNRLMGDGAIQALSKALPETMSSALLDIGTKTGNALLRKQIFDGMRVLAKPGKAWTDAVSDTEQMKRLGSLALEDSDSGDSAAELIGYLHSPTAVRTVLDQSDDDRKHDTLLLIQRAAGGLPPIVPAGIRFRLFVESSMHRLIQQPINLLGAYAMAFLGAASGIGIQVYATYRLPEFFDVARISTAIEQGLIVGSVFGLGILITRIVMERFQTPASLLRIILGSILGGSVINLSLIIFHMLFLNTPPAGLLITAGSAFIALAFSVSSLVNSRLIKTGLSILSILTAILGTWIIHIMFSASPIDLTPMFRYDYAWPPGRILFIAASASVLMGVLSRFVNLSIKND